MTTAAEEQAHWDILAANPGWAVWAEPGWEDGVGHCLKHIEAGLAPTLDRLKMVSYGLDLGCGMGRLTIPMADRHPLMRIWGVDVSPEMLAVAERYATRPPLRPDLLMPQGRPRSINWALGDGRELPYTRPLDVAWSVVTMQHIPRQAQAAYVEQIYERLRPRGRAVIQFVVGDEDEPWSQQMRVAEISLAFRNFRDVAFHGDDRFPNWQWVVAEK